MLYHVSHVTPIQNIGHVVYVYKWYKMNVYTQIANLTRNSKVLYNILVGQAILVLLIETIFCMYRSIIDMNRLAFEMLMLFCVSFIVSRCIIFKKVLQISPQNKQSHGPVVK